MRNTKRSIPNSHSVPESLSFSLAEGVRFYNAGHWWEIESSIKGRATRYFRCKPVCLVESCFYTEVEIMQALQQEFSQENSYLTLSDRGTGRLDRLTFNKDQPGKTLSNQPRKLSAGLQANKMENLKILLVGSRTVVQKAIYHLHSLGIAKPDKWSPMQTRPNSKEVLSILIQKI